MGWGGLLWWWSWSRRGGRGCAGAEEEEAGGEGGGGCWGLGCAWTGRSKGWGVPGVGKKTGRDGSACP